MSHLSYSYEANKAFLHAPLGSTTRNKETGEPLSKKLGVKIVSSGESKLLGAIGAAIDGYN